MAGKIIGWGLQLHGIHNSSPGTHGWGRPQTLKVPQRMRVLVLAYICESSRSASETANKLMTSPDEPGKTDSANLVSLNHNSNSNNNKNKNSGNSTITNSNSHGNSNKNKNISNSNRNSFRHSNSKVKPFRPSPAAPAGANTSPARSTFPFSQSQVLLTVCAVLQLRI